MATSITRILRLVAANLLTASGMGLIAVLWLRELTEVAVLDALLGATYLIIAIGLFGQSRFSLFVAALLTGGMAFFLYTGTAATEAIYQLRIAVDSIVALSSAWVLWQLRHEPSR